ncbi:MAM domain, meprin/A5/mu domain-containing protein [Ditylenchus destructor]|nr:MAM domain, meprin/A5/mu domain-containing protein [Ditylenchus destructor]
MLVILKAQRSSPTAVIPQRTLSSGSDDASKHGKDSNFYVVVSGGRNVSNHYAYFLSKKHSDDAAMIVSPFYEHTSPKCELLLRHRVLGEPGAELLVTTEQLTLSVLAHLPSFRNAHLPPANEAEDDDWIRPTLRARFQPEEGNEPWTTSRVAIGTFHYPTRIRLECHASGEDRPGVDLNVECHVDDLQLINCEEELHESTKCVDTKSERKYSCRAGGKQLCLKYDDLCDFHAECEHDEDESEDLHRCSLVPAGARCNFEELSLSAGCPNWRFFSGFSNTSSSNEKTHLVTLTTSDRRLQRGHFLFFSSYDHTTSSEHEIVYTYAVSPYFPPLSAPGYQKSSVSSGNCVVRFFYCRTGSSPFQVFLVSKDQPHESKPLWSPPKEEHTMDPCEWKRASAVIRPSNEIKMRHEYYLKLSFAKIAGSLGSIAIDDFSLTPNCFINLPPWKSRIFPSIFNASTCGFTGSEAPKVDICSELQPENAEQQKSHASGEMSPLFTGNNKWIVPETTVYRVELYAASGGVLPSQSVNNRGGAIVANIRLNASDELSLIIGQQGQSPCDSGLPKLTSKMRSLRDIICSKHPKISDIEASGRDVSSFVGTGGGGATVLFINSRPAIVVGGGAGTFLELFESGSGHQHTIEGGLLDESSANLNMSLPSVEWISGVGASLNLKVLA